MSKYLFTYRAPADFRGGPDTAPAWMGWFEQIGEHIADPGSQIMGTRAIGADSPDDSVLGGYSVVEAGDFDAALALAQGCPGLEHGFRVEVGELGYAEA